jgi:hypothetical protein
VERLPKLRRRFWVECGAAVLTVGLFILTVAIPDWVEVVFGVDPDQHSGLLEWATVVFAAAALGCLLLARLEWRRGAVAT